MASKNVKYAIIYDSWIPYRPRNWIKVAELDLLDQRITADDTKVSFYASDEASREKLLDVVTQYGSTHPSSHYVFKVWKQ